MSWSYTMILPAGVAAFTAADVVDVTPTVRTKLGLSATPAAPAAK